MQSETESMELSIDKNDVSVQFDYLVPVNGTNIIAMNHH